MFVMDRWTPPATYVVLDATAALTELTYELRQQADLRREVLLARSVTKLPAYAYRVEFARPATRLLLPIPDAASGSEFSAQASGCRLDGCAQSVRGVAREITYLSEKLWISRSNDDGGCCAAANRRPRFPPTGRAARPHRDVLRGLRAREGLP